MKVFATPCVQYPERTLGIPIATRDRFGSVRGMKTPGNFSIVKSA